MRFWSASDEDSKPKTLVTANDSYQVQYFSLNIMPFALVQSINEENWECIVLEPFARLNDQGA
jgi:hypothetical protein